MCIRRCQFLVKPVHSAFLFNKRSQNSALGSVDPTLPRCGTDPTQAASLGVGTWARSGNIGIGWVGSVPQRGSVGFTASQLKLLEQGTVKST